MGRQKRAMLESCILGSTGVGNVILGIISLVVSILQKSLPNIAMSFAFIGIGIAFYGVSIDRMISYKLQVINTDLAQDEKVNNTNQLYPGDIPKSIGDVRQLLLPVGDN